MKNRYLVKARTEGGSIHKWFYGQSAALQYCERLRFEGVEEVSMLTRGVWVEHVIFKTGYVILFLMIVVSSMLLIFT